MSNYYIKEHCCSCGLYMASDGKHKWCVADGMEGKTGCVRYGMLTPCDGTEEPVEGEKP